MLLLHSNINFNLFQYNFIIKSSVEFKTEINCFVKRALKYLHEYSCIISFAFREVKQINILLLYVDKESGYIVVVVVGLSVPLVLLRSSMQGRKEDSFSVNKNWLIVHGAMGMLNVLED